MPVEGGRQHATHPRVNHPAKLRAVLRQPLDREAIRAVRVIADRPFAGRGTIRVELETAESPDVAAAVNCGDSPSNAGRLR